MGMAAILRNNTKPFEIKCQHLFDRRLHVESGEKCSNCFRELFRRIRFHDFTFKHFHFINHTLQTLSDYSLIHIEKMDN